MAALIACGVMVAVLIGGRSLAIHIERGTVNGTAPRLFPLKVQGLALQRAAAEAPNVLPLYGSSELLRPRPATAADLFRRAPTGFQVSPVGMRGSTPLPMLQKLAALGPELRRKAIAISISPGWFLMAKHNERWYDGNFSLLAASEMAFGGELSFELKREIAAEMLEFPQRLEKSPLLEFALERLSAAGWLDRVAFCAVWPLGKLQNAIFDLQDHFETCVALAPALKSGRSLASPLRRKTLNWSRMIADAETKIPREDKVARALPNNNERLRRRREGEFIATLERSPEWSSLDLLLRVLVQIHARPLLLSMPLDGEYYDNFGVSRAARELYYKKIHAVARRYKFPLIDFEEYDEDPTFLDHSHVHLTAEGWAYYSRALDRFAHRRFRTI
jgi:D-alanine transfer protein